MASRVPYDTYTERQDYTIEKSQKYDGQSYRDAAIEEFDFFMENPFLLLLIIILIFLSMLLAGLVHLVTSDGFYGMITFLLCFGGIFLFVYIKFLKDKYRGLK